MNKTLTYIISGKLINTYYQDFDEEYLTTICPKDEYSWYELGEHYIISIRANTMLHAYYCFENRTIYYFDNQARLRMKTETNNYDLVYFELKRVDNNKYIKSLEKKINKAFREGYYD